ncbi:hypothetical protein RFI_03621 [Reticulomyxa filosa]|uniref:Uncharacterized protein n=1 Tax=Reticulomyxa filosa TaxID=46433 RepID=X6P4M2_RETFI|nr:hypothetical protein RFI_03621 [Reticulomyxa filosa]|eukprot:ETO33480.1 hypothetical protein RFI_03621 [Reticulomyxa filosa]
MGGKIIDKKKINTVETNQTSQKQVVSIFHPQTAKAKQTKKSKIGSNRNNLVNNNIVENITSHVSKCYLKGGRKKKVKLYVGKTNM